MNIDRANWGPGPWDNEPDRLEWRHNGTPCLMVRNRFGVWCGYAAVPPGHPLYGVPYQALSRIEVHGQLTYSDMCQGDVCHVPAPGEPDDVWWLGFDCGHVFDRMPVLEDYGSWGTYRDLEYVKRETEALADQIHER